MLSLNFELEAKKYGVKVIPSFDSPGHVDQILRAHPEYGQVNSSGEHFASGLDVTNPEAIAYIRSLYSEYMDLFEGCTDFHIGGDEYMEFDRAPFTTQYKSVLAFTPYFLASCKISLTSSFVRY